MSYGLKYQTQFNSQTDDNTASIRYTLQFLFKDYSGGVTSITGGDTTVIHKSNTDDPFAPIKGQSLSINLINYGNIPLTAFYADEDDGIQVILKDENDNIKFIGFIVQEDSYEEMVDFAHQISLSANDSLGLLKGVVLNEAEVRRSFLASFRTNGDNSVIYFHVPDNAFYPQAGNIIEIQGNSYTITSVVEENTTIGIAIYNWTVTVSPATGGISQTVDTIYLTGAIDLEGRNSLFSLIAVCLSNTNLSLITNIFCNIKCYPQDELRSHFEQTVIDSQTFLLGEVYDDCYSVLSKILSTFNCSLFQANGQWNIIHWEEMRFYTGNVIPAYQYDETYSFLGTTVLNNNFFIGPDPQLTRPVYPLNRGSFSAYKFVRKQFDYRQPKYLLKNYDLLKTGDLIRTYASGANQYYEYEATDWMDAFGSPYAERFIRVLKDALGNEIERYMVVRGDCFDSVRTVISKGIEATTGAKIKFSFSTRTNISQPSPFGAVFAVRLTNGTIQRFVDEVPVDNGDWINLPGYSISLTNNTNTWHNIEIASSQIPFNGMVHVFLAQNVDTPYNSSRETHYKDIRFEYTPYINDTTKIIGHTHKQDITPNIKNNLDENIYVDDSPSNSIAGTLFLQSITDLVQDRTQFWRYIYHPSDEYYKLGELMTEEQIRWRKKLRTKLEGSFIGLYQDNCISLLTIGKTSFDINKNYVPGLMSIDYKRNLFNATWWEVWDSEETALESDYSFTYLYSTT